MAAGSEKPRDSDSTAGAERTNDPAPHYSAEEARGGEIILRTRNRRILFLAGLVGIVLLALLIRLAAYW